MTIHILPHDITVKAAQEYAKERGLVVCLNKAGRIAAMPEVLPGWWTPGALTKINHALAGGVM